MNRQQKWQKEKIEQGLCRICGKKAIEGIIFCDTHLKKSRIQSLNRYKRKREEIKISNRNRYRKKHGIQIDAPILRVYKPRKLKDS